MCGGRWSLCGIKCVVVGGLFVTHVLVGGLFVTHVVVGGLVVTRGGR